MLKQIINTRKRVGLCLYKVTADTQEDRLLKMWPISALYGFIHKGASGWGLRALCSLKDANTLLYGDITITVLFQQRCSALSDAGSFFN